MPFHVMRYLAILRIIFQSFDGSALAARSHAPAALVSTEPPASTTDSVTNASKPLVAPYA
jgi:hypothetical protein